MKNNLKLSWQVLLDLPDEQLALLLNAPSYEMLAGLAESNPDWFISRDEHTPIPLEILYTLLQAHHGEKDGGSPYHRQNLEDLWRDIAFSPWEMPTSYGWIKASRGKTEHDDPAMKEVEQIPQSIMDQIIDQVGDAPIIVSHKGTSHVVVALLDDAESEGTGLARILNTKRIISELRPGERIPANIDPWYVALVDIKYFDGIQQALN